MSVKQHLEQLGFRHHSNDEPFEDYWILDTYGNAADYLVENEGTGWRILRSPDASEVQGEWVDVKNGLTDEQCMLEIDKLIG